jgi:hypothetical protein
MGKKVNYFFGLIVLLFGLLILILPDPSSITDLIALLVILGGMSLLGVNVGVLGKNIKGLLK